MPREEELHPMRPETHTPPIVRSSRLRNAGPAPSTAGAANAGASPVPGATPEEMRLLYPELHAFREAMKPQTVAGARVDRALCVLLIAGGLAMVADGVVTACTSPDLHDAGGLIFGGVFLLFASGQFTEGLSAWDEKRRDGAAGGRMTSRDRSPLG